MCIELLPCINNCRKQSNETFKDYQTLWKTTRKFNTNERRKLSNFTSTTHDATIATLMNALINLWNIVESSHTAIMTYASDVITQLHSRYIAIYCTNTDVVMNIRLDETNYTVQVSCQYLYHSVHAIYLLGERNKIFIVIEFKKFIYFIVGIPTLQWKLLLSKQEHHHLGNENSLSSSRLITKSTWKRLQHSHVIITFTS